MGAHLHMHARALAIFEGFHGHLVCTGAHSHWLGPIMGPHLHMHVRALSHCLGAIMRAPMHMHSRALAHA